MAESEEELKSLFMKVKEESEKVGLKLNIRLVHGDDPERCYGEGGGRGVHVWERMYTRGGFMSMYDKTNTVL